MGLRAKIAIAILCWSILIVLTVSVIEAEHAIALTVDNLGATGDLIVNQLFEQVRTTLASGPRDPILALQSASDLRALTKSAGAYAKGVVYARIEAADGAMIVSDPPSIGLPDALPFAALRRSASSWSGALAIYLDAGASTYEVVRRVELGGKPFCLIRVGLSTALTAAEIQRSIRNIVLVGTGVLSLGIAGAILLGGLLLKPVVALMTEVQELAAGRTAHAVSVGGRDALSSLAQKFNELSQKVSSDRFRWEQERDQLLGVFQSIKDAVILLDAHGEVLFANSEASGRLGLPAGHAIDGKPLRVLLGKDHPLSLIVTAAYATSTHAHDVPMQLGGGEDAIRLLVSVFALGQGSEPAGVLVIVRDLEPVAELKRALDYSGRLVRLGALISGVGHQVRNPLNSMNVQLELLREDVIHGRPVDNRIETVRSQIHRLDRAVDALMRVMKPELLQISEIAVDDLVRDIAARVARPHIRIQCDCDRRVPLLRVDRPLLEEALANIATNAVEAMANGGNLKLASSLRDDGYIEIAIADDGDGIPSEQLEHIFRLYYTTKPGGSGLGLALALRAIDLHQGIIDVESVVGSGTTFKIRLPISN